MPNVNAGQLTDPIILNDGDRIVVQEEVIAPIGQPAVNIVGEDARLIVTSSGSLSAPDEGNTAVLASGEDARITNSGSISGALNGISSTGDDLRLVNSDTITSDSRAVDLSDGDGLVVQNSGRILGTGNQRNGTLYVDGTVDDLHLTNSGIIDAGTGNLGDAVSIQVGADGDDSNEDINIINSGVIQGRGDGSEVFADGARVAANGSSGLRFFNGSGQPEASVTGSVINNGTITSEVNVGFLGGLVVEDGVAYDGRIVNGRRGTISGPRNGLYIGNAEHDLDVTNFGRIESGSRAVNIDGSGVNLRNSGTIIGTGDQRNGTVYADATAENFSIRNDRRGVIDAGEGNQGAGISLQIGDVDGDVVEASIRNDGLIRGRGDAPLDDNLSGDGVRLFSGVTDGSVTLRGNIENRGRINATGEGIVVDDGVTLLGEIDNRGRITSETADGLDVTGTLTGDVNNRGTIESDVQGIDINDEGIVNGNINNSTRGVIRGEIDGIDIDGVLDGDINNRGLIEAVTDGIDVGGTIVGSINNFGTIRGEVNAINAQGSDVSVNVNNRGTLNGDILLSSSNDIFDSSRGVINGTVSGLDGDDRLIGSRSSDVLVGGLGSDTLTGGRGSDTFVYGPDDLGADIITDYRDGTDLLDVSAFNFGVADLQAVIAGAQQIGSDTLLTFAPNNTALLEGVQTSAIDTSDFVVL